MKMLAVGRTAIAVQNLVTHYGSLKILDDVSVSIKHGEIMAIMGGSGSGKSTLLRYTLGLHKPSAGQITILGKNINHISQNEWLALRKNMGVAFQGGALFSSMSVAENVELPLRENTRLDENTIDIIRRMKLEVVNLAGCDDLMPAQLSGGMIKRVALARAIVMDPKLLFLDEPSAGLDPVVSAELDELILHLRAAMRMTIVIVTHELDSALKIADRITVLDEGKIIMCDTVHAVRNSDNKRVQNLLNRRPRRKEIDAQAYLNRLTRNG